jgi:hypothetical protein
MRKRAPDIDRVAPDSINTRSAGKDWLHKAVELGQQMVGRTVVMAYERNGLDPMWREVRKYRWLRVEFGPDRRRRVVFLRVGRGQQGQIVCTGLLIGGELPVTVTARDLRAIPLSRLLADARTDANSFGWWVKQNLATKGSAVPVLRPGPKGHPRAHFEAVANAYRRAVEEDPAPVRRLSAEFRTPEGRPTPEPTVRRWIQRARDMELLGRSTPGRAGEQLATTKQQERKRR